MVCVSFDQNVRALTQAKSTSTFSWHTEQMRSQRKPTIHRVNTYVVQLYTTPSLPMDDHVHDDEMKQHRRNLTVDNSYIKLTPPNKTPLSRRNPPTCNNTNA